MIDFLVNLAPNLRPKAHQKSTQEVPKIDKKGIKNMMQVGLKFGGLLGRFWWILVASWGASWDQVGTKIRKMTI